MLSTMLMVASLVLSQAVGPDPQWTADVCPSCRRGDAPLICVIVDVEAEGAIPPPDGGLYVACDANGWNPGDPAWKLNPSPGPGRSRPSINSPALRTFCFQLPATVPDNKPIAYKITCGSWETVEVQRDGSDAENRRWNLDGIPSHGINIIRVEGFAQQRGTRWPGMTPPTKPGDVKPTVTGDLDILDVHSSTLGNDRKVRVWMPPGYKDGANASKRYPVLYMHDGQNCFDAATSAFGVEWGCDETATALIKAGKIPPMIIVGIDNATIDRAREYNPPYTTFQGKTNHGDRYLAFLCDELMPRINKEYRTLTGPGNTSLGGSSFGGNITVYAVMERPGVFGRILVESPAMFIDDRKILKKAEQFERWPERVFLAVGTAESAGAGEAKAFADLTRDLDAALKAKGLGPDRLMVVVEEGAKHNEAAWAKRLPGAFEFLFGTRLEKAPK